MDGQQPLLLASAYKHHMVLNLLVPVRCPACDKPGGTAGLCRRCVAEAWRLRLSDGGGVALAEGVAALGAFAYEGPVRDAIVAAKTRGRHGAARALGDLLRAVVRPPAGPATWVPSTRRTRRRRGFELPRLLAGPGAVRLLDQVAERADQTTLSLAQRLASPAGAFAPRGAVPSRVVLYDDVRTTGATAKAAAAALRQGGAERVLVVTLAVAGARLPSAGTGALGHSR